jgi:hypothetical protein
MSCGCGEKLGGCCSCLWKEPSTKKDESKVMGGCEKCGCGCDSKDCGPNCPNCDCFKKVEGGGKKKRSAKKHSKKKSHKKSSKKKHSRK